MRAGRYSRYSVTQHTIRTNRNADSLNFNRTTVAPTIMKLKFSTGIFRLAAASLVVTGGGSVMAQEVAPDIELPEIALDDRELFEPLQLEERPGEDLAQDDSQDNLEEGFEDNGEYESEDESSFETGFAPAEVVETPLEELQRNFFLYKEALENENNAEADTYAKRVVELSIEIFGIDSLDSARALTNLGIAQHRNEEYESAQLNYSAAIDIIERTEDRLNANLINPLKGLGAAQLAAGRPNEAIESFDRAVHVSHVNEGPHNLMQVEVLQSLSETYLGVGEPSMAEKIQDHVFQLQARDVDLKSVDILPVLENQALWQHRLQLFEKERYTWRKVIDVIEDHYGKDDLRLIPPLTQLGRSHLFVGTTDMSFHQPTSITSGEIYLKRALRIAENNPDSTWRTREEAMLALGDFYIMSGKPNRARGIYEDAWQLLSVDEERLENRRDHLESLIVLQRINPPKYVGIDGEVRSQLPGENFEVGTIVYDYTVNTRGFTADIALSEATPPGFTAMEQAVLRNLRGMIHRPRLDDGTPVTTEGLTYTHKFFYRASDLPATAEPGDVAATTTN